MMNHMMMTPQRLAASAVPSRRLLSAMTTTSTFRGSKPISISAASTSMRSLPLAASYLADNDTSPLVKAATRWKSSIPFDQRRAGDAITSTSTASSPSSSSPSSSPSLNPIPDFNDAKAAYESKSTKELLRAAACFRLCQVQPLINEAELLLNVSRKIFGGTLVDFILKQTLFGHFCAGEDEIKIKPILRDLDQVGIGSILDYAAESDGTPEQLGLGIPSPTDTMQAREYDYESEAQCDAHVKTFEKCIKDVADLGTKDGYAAIKVTALGNPKLLARMSQAIVEAKRLFTKFDEDNDGFVNREEFERGYNVFFADADIGAKELIEKLDPDNTNQVDYITWSMNLTPKDLPQITASCREVGPLALATPTEEEIELIERMFERGRTLAECAAKHGTRLLIDAEQVRYQPAIDNLVLGLQQTFNSTEKTDFPIVYNTYQCYLTDSTERLRSDLERSERFDYHFGAKLVRGAYMESERELAYSIGMPSPIYDTIKETHDCYNDNVEYLLREAATSDPSKRNIEVMCATHNQESIEKAIAVMNDCGVDRADSVICFGQLYGMKDNLSFNLGRHGYRAYKYVPYGLVSEVMPYLLRRARENSAIVGGASVELDMIRSEVRRRMRSSVGMSTA